MVEWRGDVWPIIETVTNCIGFSIVEIDCSTTDKSASNIISLPLAFVRSGYVHLAEGYVGVVGLYGYGRSRTASSTTDAYRLSFGPSGLDMDPASRYWGFPLRCR